MVPQDEIDCFLLSRIPPESAWDAVPLYLQQYTIPETRPRTFRTLRHLIQKATLEFETAHFEDPSIRTGVMQAAQDNLDSVLFDTIVDEFVERQDLDGSKAVFEAVHKAIAQNPHFKFTEISPRCEASAPPLP